MVTKAFRLNIRLGLKPRINRILLLLLLPCLWLGCDSGSKAYKMKVATTAPLEEPGSQILLKFTELVNKRSQGRIEAKLYPSGALGNNRDVTEGLLLGTIEVQMASSSPLSVFVPSLNIFEMPFLFDNNEHMFAVLDSEIGERYRPDLEAAGFHLLGYFTFGVRHIMTTERPINSIEDMKGLKIRTMESPPHLDGFKAFGANPLPMAYSELYTGLETGVIDGAEAANSNYYSKKFYEVAPYWAQLGWLRLVAPVIMRKSFYDKLPPDLRKIVDDSLAELVDEERTLYTDVSTQRLEQLKELGITVTYPDPGPFRAAANEVYEKWADRVGGWDLINEIKKIDYEKDEP